MSESKPKCDEKPCDGECTEKEHKCNAKDKPSVNCPKCGKPDKVVPIVFGLPTPDLCQQADEGKIAMGGCCMPMDGDPPRDYKCRDCNEEF